MERHAALSESFLGALHEIGLEAVDLRPALAGPAEDSFWLEDQHLSVRGHRKLAGALVGRFAQAPELRK